MRARGSVLAVAGVAIAASLAPSPAFAEDATPFDGAWNAEVVCLPSANGAGYTWRLPVRIAAGTLNGTYRSPTTAAEGELDGWVRADGKALVSVIGVTGNDQSIGHLGRARGSAILRTSSSTATAARASARSFAPAR